MIKRFKEAMNVSDEIKTKNSASNKIFLHRLKHSFFATLAWVFSLSAAGIALFKVINPDYHPGQLAIAICFIFYGGVLGIYIYKNLIGYYSESSNIVIADSLIDNDCLYKIIKDDPVKYPPELSDYLIAWKAENDEKEKNKLFRKLTALFKLCCENQDAKILSKQTKTTYEKIIGSIIDISTLNGTMPPQTRIIEEIIDLYDINTEDKKGLSERNLAGILSDSNLIHEAALIKRAHHVKMKTKIAI